MIKLRDNEAWHRTPMGQVPDGIDMLCGVCGAIMTVRRNQPGAPSIYSQATGAINQWHDLFECPRMGQPWHIQVVNIRAEATKTASTKLRNMLLEEADEILKQAQSSDS